MAEVTKTFPDLIKRLQHASWSPLMGEPEDPNLPKPVPRPPIKVGGNILKSKLIREVEPVYPELAKQAHVQGRVVLAVTVDGDGNVSDIEVTSGHPLLAQAAKAAVGRWKYSPPSSRTEVPQSKIVLVRFTPCRVIARCHAPPGSCPGPYSVLISSDFWPTKHSSVE
jgi:TonB family protein